MILMNTLETNSAQASETAAPLAEEPQAARRLLIVEENDDGRGLLIEGLGAAGYIVSGAKMGKEGLALAFETLPDLMLLNPRMAGMDGMKAIKLLKTVEPVRRRPLIALFDGASRDEIVRVIQAGAEGCLTKNISVHAIHQKIQQILRQTRPALQPVFEHLAYAVSASKDGITIGIESDLTGDACKDLVQLARVFIPLQPFTLFLSFEKVGAVATSAIGYLSEVKDVSRDCGGKLLLANFKAEKYLPNIQRVVKTNFQFA